MRVGRLTGCPMRPVRSDRNCMRSKRPDMHVFRWIWHVFLLPELPGETVEWHRPIRSATQRVQEGLCPGDQTPADRGLRSRGWENRRPAVSSRQVSSPGYHSPNQPLEDVAQSKGTSCRGGLSARDKAFRRSQSCTTESSSMAMSPSMCAGSGLENLGVEVEPGTVGDQDIS